MKLIIQSNVFRKCGYILNLKSNEYKKETGKIGEKRIFSYSRIQGSLAKLENNSVIKALT